MIKYVLNQDEAPASTARASTGLMPATARNVRSLPSFVLDFSEASFERAVLLRKKLAEDLAAAIRTAQEGFPLPEWTAAYWAGSVDYLRTDDTATKTYLPNDRQEIL